MLILSNALLYPCQSKEKNPLSTVFNLIEGYLLGRASDETYGLFLKKEWPALQKLFIQKIMRGKGKGRAIQELVAKSPDEHLLAELSTFNSILRGSKYYISDLWWAMVHWLKFGAMSPKYPQVGQSEVRLIEKMLTEPEINFIKANDMEKKLDMDALFKSLQPRIRAICKKKASFLSFADATFSLEDLVQDMNCLVLSSLYAKDHVFEDPADCLGWISTSIDNALKNMAFKATRPSRSRLSSTIFAYDDERFPVSDPPTDFKEILQKISDPRIKRYLMMLLDQEYHPEFWSWFSRNQPHLSKRDLYKAELPEAIGPWMQRWLGLSQRELIHFLQTHLPDILIEANTRNAKQTKPVLLKGA